MLKCTFGTFSALADSVKPNCWGQMGNLRSFSTAFHFDFLLLHINFHFIISLFVVFFVNYLICIVQIENYADFMIKGATFGYSWTLWDVSNNRLLPSERKVNKQAKKEKKIKVFVCLYLCICIHISVFVFVYYVWKDGISAIAATCHLLSAPLLWREQEICSPLSSLIYFYPSFPHFLHHPAICL